MPDLPSRLDLFRIGRDFVLQRAKKIDPAQIDVQGSDVNIFVGATSVMAAAIVDQLAFSIARLLLDGAEGDDLDRYALDRYNLVRKAASAAVVTLNVSRVAAGPAGSVPVGTKILTLTGIEYITTSVIVFGAGDKKSSGDARAVQAGKATQVGANALRKFANVSQLFDQTLQVNNNARAAGGEDREDDETFRERIRDFWSTARRGTLGAIEFGARSVPGVVSAQAIEAITGGNMPARVVNLYIADSSGVANQALANAVRQQLDEFRAGGIAVLVFPSLPQIVALKLKLAFSAAVDTAALGDNVRAAIVEFVNSLRVNETLHLGAIYSVLQRFSASGLIVNDQTVVLPVGDLVPTPGSTLRTTLGDVALAA